MDETQAPRSHWPNFRPCNTTLFMCEKRGALVCICVGFFLFVIPQATRPGLDRVLLLVQLSVAKAAVQNIP